MTVLKRLIVSDFVYSNTATSSSILYQYRHHRCWCDVYGRSAEPAFSGWHVRRCEPVRAPVQLHRVRDETGSGHS